MDVPVRREVQLEGGRGGEEGLYRTHLSIDTPGYVWLRGVGGVHEGNIHP
jgi:hypothetical protein